MIPTRHLTISKCRQAIASTRSKKIAKGSTRLRSTISGEFASASWMATPVMLRFVTVASEVPIAVDLYDAAQRLKNDVGRIKPLRVA